jgi:hypothetical protein
MHYGTEMLVMRADITKVKLILLSERENLPINAYYALRIT